MRFEEGNQGGRVNNESALKIRINNTHFEELESFNHDLMLIKFISYPEIKGIPPVSNQNIPLPRILVPPN